MAVTRTMDMLRFEVRPNDPLALAAVTAVLLAVAARTGWVLARGATRVDPAVALRLEQWRPFYGRQKGRACTFVCKLS